MPVPREIIDSLESVLGIYFSRIRHRERAAFILTDELVEMTCKLRAREANHKFDMKCGFHDAWNAPGVAIATAVLGHSIQASRNTRNNMQHASAAATVDDEHCANAILDAVSVIDHCWPGGRSRHETLDEFGSPNCQTLFQDWRCEEKTVVRRLDARRLLAI